MDESCGRVGWTIGGWMSRVDKLGGQLGEADSVNILLQSIILYPFARNRQLR